MVLFAISIPLLISFFIGYFLIRILDKDGKLDLFLMSFLAFGLGLGISAFLTFLSFILFNEFNRPFIVGANIILLAGLLLKIFYFNRREKINLRSLKPLPQEIVLLLILLAASFPLWPYAKLYPYGGWDAWQVWN